MWRSKPLLLLLGRWGCAFDGAMLILFPEPKRRKSLERRVCMGTPKLNFGSSEYCLQISSGVWGTWRLVVDDQVWCWAIQQDSDIHPLRPGMGSVRKCLRFVVGPCDHSEGGRSACLDLRYESEILLVVGLAWPTKPHF